MAPQAWQLLVDCGASPRAALFVSPSARLARVPWGLLAMPDGDGHRLMELADVLMAAPSDIIHSSPTPAGREENPRPPPPLFFGPPGPGPPPPPPGRSFSSTGGRGPTARAGPCVDVPAVRRHNPRGQNLLRG